MNAARHTPALRTLRQSSILRFTPSKDLEYQQKNEIGVTPDDASHHPHSPARFGPGNSVPRSAAPPQSRLRLVCAPPIVSGRKGGGSAPPKPPTSVAPVSSRVAGCFSALRGYAGVSAAGLASTQIKIGMRRLSCLHVVELCRVRNPQVSHDRPVRAAASASKRCPHSDVRKNLGPNSRERCARPPPQSGSQ